MRNVKNVVLVQTVQTGQQHGGVPCCRVPRGDVRGTVFILLSWFPRQNPRHKAPFPSKGTGYQSLAGFNCAVSASVRV